MTISSLSSPAKGSPLNLLKYLTKANKEWKIDLELFNQVTSKGVVISPLVVNPIFNLTIGQHSFLTNTISLVDSE